MAVKNRAEHRAKAFDPSVREGFSRLLQYSKAFRFDLELRSQFNFACVVQDRLLDAIHYLDSHLEPPRTDPDFYLFMVYADNVFSAVTQVFSVFKGKISYPYDDSATWTARHKFFARVVRSVYPGIPDEKIPTDDQFFKYFRSLSFAHPYETTHGKFLEKAEIQYSPFVLNNSNVGLPYDIPDAIGIKVYSNVRDPDDFSVILSYSSLKDFLISRYETLRCVIEYIQGLVNDKLRAWLEHKANRSRKPLELLEEVREIYVERYEETYFVDEAIRLLTAPLSFGSAKNETCVTSFRHALEAVVLPVCDALEKPDYEAAANLIDDVISPDIPDWPEDPNNGYRGMKYHYGKVAEYCRHPDCGRNDYKEIDLHCLMDGFVSKWVDIDPDRMSRDEIWLLVSAAWYEESVECRRLGKLNRGPVTIAPVEKLLKSICKDIDGEEKP